MGTLTREQEAELEAIISEAIKAGPPVPNFSPAQIIFNQAAAFHSGAIHCSQEVLTPEGGSQGYTLPSIIKYAFSVELYFKSLLTKRGSSVKGHGLKNLFMKLQENEKNQIFHYYNIITDRSTAEFSSDLEGLSNAFVEWRYIYEQNQAGISLGRLVSLARATYMATCDLVSEWKASPHIDEAIRQEPPAHIARIISFGDGRMMKVEIVWN